MENQQHTIMIMVTAKVIINNMSKRIREELTSVPKVYDDEGKKLLSVDIWTHFNNSTPRTNNGWEGYNSRLYRRATIRCVLRNLNSV